MSKPEGFDPVDRSELSRRSRRSFLWMAGVMSAAFGGWRWLISRPDDHGVPWPFRRAHEFNEGLWRTLSSPARLSPTFTKSQVQPLRQNGMIGLRSSASDDGEVVRLEAGRDEVRLTLEDIMSRGSTEVITELRCIEGWSRIVHWTGVRLHELLNESMPSCWDLFEYAYAETPEPSPGIKDEKYFVGLEREAYLHPQTLLCWAMNGEPLRPGHGAPLRLVVPVKYGIKSLKRVSLIRLSDARPNDYWYERGYDWYSGH